MEVLRRVSCHVTRACAQCRTHVAGGECANKMDAHSHSRMEARRVTLTSREQRACVTLFTRLTLVLPTCDVRVMSPSVLCGGSCIARIVHRCRCTAQHLG